MASINSCCSANCCTSVFVVFRGHRGFLYPISKVSKSSSSADDSWDGWAGNPQSQQPSCYLFWHVCSDENYLWRMMGEDYILQLVGGLVAIFYFPIYWVSNHPNWLSYFSEGWPWPTNQNRIALNPWLAGSLYESGSWHWVRNWLRVQRGNVQQSLAFPGYYFHLFDPMSHLFDPERSSCFEANRVNLGWILEQ